MPWQEWIELAPVQWTIEEELESREAKGQRGPIKLPVFSPLLFLFIAYVVQKFTFPNMGGSAYLALLPLIALYFVCAIWNLYAGAQAAKPTGSGPDAPARMEEAP
jgi:hypothetical protein